MLMVQEKREHRAQRLEGAVESPQTAACNTLCRMLSTIPGCHRRWKAGAQLSTWPHAGNSFNFSFSVCAFLAGRVSGLT